MHSDQATFTIRAMTIGDYETLIGLMTQTPGVTVRDADSHSATGRYLERNPGLSFLAMIGDQAVGCIMSGHDGRRAYLQHLVVLPEYRRQGVATALVECCLRDLSALGIVKSHIDVLKSNIDAHAYWERQGWQLRTDIDRYSFVLDGDANA